MKFPFFKKNILITALVYCCFSCSSDLDFEQANDFNIQPVVTTNLAYINADASAFISNGAESPLLSFTSNVNFLNTSIVREDMVKTEMYFRIKNTIARSFVLNVVFLDINNAVIYNIPPMFVAPYAGTEVLFERTETFDAAKVDVLKRTTKMVFYFAMLPGAPLTEASPGRLELSSSITAYFDIK